MKKLVSTYSTAAIMATVISLAATAPVFAAGEHVPWRVRLAGGARSGVRGA